MAGWLGGGEQVRPDGVLLLADWEETCCNPGVWRLLKKKCLRRACLAGLRIAIFGDFA